MHPDQGSNRQPEGAHWLVSDPVTFSGVWDCILPNWATNFLIEILIEIIVDSRAVIRNNPERSPVSCTQFPPMIPFCKTIHNITTRMLTSIEPTNLFQISYFTYTQLRMYMSI